MLSLPIVVALAAKAADARRWPASLYWFLGAVAVIFSKVWLRLDSAPAPARVPDAELVRSYYRYFSHHGPYMPNDAYLVSAAALVVELGLLWWMRRGPCRRRRRHAPWAAGLASAQPGTRG